MKGLNAFTASTAKNLQLDAGIVMRNLESPKTATVEQMKQAVIGATSGGGSFAAVPEVRNIFEDLDGARGNYKDGNAIDNWDITLTCTFKEMTAENIKMALGAADITKASSSDKHDSIKGRLDIKSTDYYDNICWAGTINGSAEPMIIVLKNAMNTNGFNFSFTDKGTGGVELEIKAHFDVENPNDVPFEILTPKVSVGE